MARKSNKSDRVEEQSQEQSDQERTIEAKQRMLAALEQNYGVITQSARESGINRSTHYEWMRTDPDYKKQVDEMSEVALDFVEEMNFKEIKNGNATLIKFYLATKGRVRGFKEKQDLVLDADDGTTTELTWRIVKKRHDSDDQPQAQAGK